MFRKTQSSFTNHFELIPQEEIGSAYKNLTDRVRSRVVAPMMEPRVESRSLSRLLVSVAGLATAALATTCSPASPLPGTPLGTYSVTGALQGNTCGAGLGAPNPWSFSVQMSEDGTTFYWELSGGSEASGTVSSTQVSITSIQTANVDAPDAGLEGPCNLQSTTAINLTLATSSPPATFTGTVSYTFAAATGVSSMNDCTDQLSASGGTYDTLPCTATYALTGTRQ
jgi:hypothetical protein